MDEIKPHLLVIGGTGYIGQNICKKAILNEWRVDSLSQNRIKNNLDKINKVNYITGDLIRDKNRCKEQLSNYDYVVNASGYVDHSPFFKGGIKNIESHFRLIVNLIQILDKTNLKMFVQIGSSDEYGNSKAPQNEELREGPISPYSLGKVASAHFLQMLSKTEQFPSVVLRVFLTYGPGQKSNRFIPQIINGCANDIAFPTSEGMQLRDFCYIDDVVDAIFLALKKQNICGEIINIGSGEQIKIRELVEKIRLIIGKGNPQYGDYPYRKGENMALYPDLRKSKKLLGWNSKVSLEEGLKKTIDWYLKDGKTLS